ncbi:SLOG family protein [Lactobacillaceae bacterium Scapto_B20]
MQRLWITGYRSYELGIFRPKDPKLDVIKFVLRNQMIQAIESGYQWFITGGQMGIEQWSVEVAAELKQQYPDEFKIAVMLPFTEFGSQWNENNRLKLSQIKQLADFSASISDHPYQSPQQLRNYQEFMLGHTDGALMIYDDNKQGKSMYDYQAIQKYQQRAPYDLKMIDFDDLQEAADEYQENQNNSFQ